MPKSKKNNERLVVYLPPEYCHAIRLRAALENRSLGAIALELIQKSGIKTKEVA